MFDLGPYISEAGDAIARGVQNTLREYAGPLVRAVRVSVVIGSAVGLMLAAAFVAIGYLAGKVS